MSLPESVEEWASYISSLTGDQLRSKAIAANSLEFVRVLQEEGLASEVVNILVMFAVRLEEEGQLLPSVEGQYLHYGDLLSAVDHALGDS